MRITPTKEQIREKVMDALSVRCRLILEIDEFVRKTYPEVAARHIKLAVEKLMREKRIVSFRAIAYATAPKEAR